MSTSSSGMCLSLPPGSVVSGAKETYTIQNLLCMSNRSATYACRSADGTVLRLKLYGGNHSLSDEVRRKLYGLRVQGVLLPRDTGTTKGVPFLVFPALQAESTAASPVPQEALVKRLIPQMTSILIRCHAAGLLLRDICPEHILYNRKEQKFLYCGLGNAAVLPKGVTITKAEGYGQEECFLAPEVPKYGYSACSDYFALGVTLLCLVRGSNPMQNMSTKEVQERLTSGEVPGIDTAYLKKTPYRHYSGEDRILYLILGLLLADPRQRWGAGEIRCWCNNQQIPLVRKGGRIQYQYKAPFFVGTEKCWNSRQLAQVLAADSEAWTVETLKRLETFARQQKIAEWDLVAEEWKLKGIGTEGKLFRCLYGLHPGLDGLWWKGVKFQDAGDLAARASASRTSAAVLAQLLTSRSLSFFLRMRKQISPVKDSDIAEMEQIEQWEIAEPGKGVSRFLMRFAAGKEARSFRVEGREYRKIEDLIAAYKTRPVRFRAISAEILQDKNFQAWLWAQGREAAGSRAAEISRTDPEQSLYLLLKIAEDSLQRESDRKSVREWYLNYGDYAPVWWLTRHVGEYRLIPGGDASLADALKRANLSLDQPLEQLSHTAADLVPAYQRFAAATVEGPLQLAAGQTGGTSYYPEKEDGFFCCVWRNGLEVCPAFLNRIGEKPDSKVLSAWVEQDKEAAGKILDAELLSLQSSMSGSDIIGGQERYLKTCRNNMAVSAGMFVVAILLFIRQWEFSAVRAAGLILALVFPVFTFAWYYQRKTRADYWYKVKDSVDSQRAYYTEIKNSLETSGKGLIQRVEGGHAKSVCIPDRPKTTVSGTDQALERLSFTGIHRFVGILSAAGLLLLALLYPESIVICVVNICIAVVLIAVWGTKSAVDWTVLTVLLLLPTAWYLFFADVYVPVILEMICAVVIVIYEKITKW